MWGSYGRRPALVLAGVAFIDAVERGILPGALSKAQDDLGFSDFQAGLLGSAVVIASVVMVLPAGYLADRFHRPRLIGGVLATWGLVAAVTASVQSWGQFMAARSALGLADTIDNPASSSLLADYYPMESRGRAYGLLRVAPIFGVAVGTGLGGVIAAALGWRWSFLLIGVPGSLFALTVLRLPHPTRGQQDRRREETIGPREVAPTIPGPDERRSVNLEIRLLLRVKSLRALALGAGIASGGISGIGFWAPSFFERHGGLSGGAAAGVTGGLILVGAIGGILAGSRLSDRLRARDPGGAMLQAGVSQMLAAVVFVIAFLDLPVWFVQVPLFMVGVPLIVNALPGLSATTAEIVPPELRGMAFSIAAFVSTTISAVSAPLIGLLADQFEFLTETADGPTIEGNLAYAFQMVVPLLAVGGWIVLRGRHFVAQDATDALA